MRIEFFMPMVPPTATHQEKQVRVVKGKPVFYEPPGLRDARDKLTAHLSRHKPDRPLEGGVRLLVKWCFPRGRHADGEYRITKPDTDNLQKLLKDCMTAAGFWKDDAQAASEITEKFWAETPGIYICAEELAPQDCGHCFWYEPALDVCCNPDSVREGAELDPGDTCGQWEGEERQAGAAGGASQRP